MNVTCTNGTSWQAISVLRSYTGSQIDTCRTCFARIATPRNLPRLQDTGAADIPKRRVEGVFPLHCVRGTLFV